MLLLVALPLVLLLALLVLLAKELQLGVRLVTFTAQSFTHPSIIHSAAGVSVDRLPRCGGEAGCAKNFHGVVSSARGHGVSAAAHESRCPPTLQPQQAQSLGAGRAFFWHSEGRCTSCFYVCLCHDQ